MIRPVATAHLLRQCPQPQRDAADHFRGSRHDRRFVQGISVGQQITGDALVLKPALTRCGLGLRRANRCAMHLFHCLHHALRAPGKTIHFAKPAACPAAPGVMLIKCSINAAQHGCQWNASLAPRLDQRPVQRRKQEDASTPRLEASLDFREVVEIVLH